MDTDAKITWQSIRNQLTSDRTASELKWSWFCAALFSYKRNFLLRPFPPAFRKVTVADQRSIRNLSIEDDDSKDFDGLMNLAKTVPPLANLNLQDDDGFTQLSPDQIRLLAWVLDTQNQFRMVNVGKEMYEQMKKFTGQQHTAKVPEPDYVFRIEYDQESESKFARRRGQSKTVYAYHGSRLPNFYSIMKNGLRANLNQISAFGEGTYLSPELSVSLNWSPMSSVNSSTISPVIDEQDSLEGARLSCVAVCEVIDDPSQGGISRCECAFDASSSSSVDQNPGLRRNGNDVPDRYILVKNDDLLRIRYVLAYVDRSNIRKTYLEHGTNICNRMTAFCNRHRFWLIMLSYFVLLTAVGLASSRNFQWYMRRFWMNTNEYGYIDGEYPAENYHRTYEDT